MAQGPVPPAESDAQVTDHPPVCHEASPTDSWRTLARSCRRCKCQWGFHSSWSSGNEACHLSLPTAPEPPYSPSPLETQTYSCAIQWSLQRDDGCPQCSRHEWIWNTDIHHPGPGRLAPVRCDEHQEVGPEAFQPVSLVTTSSLLQEYRLLVLLLRSSSNTHGSHWRALWRSTIRGFRGSKAPFQDRNIRCITAKIKQFDDVEQSCGVNCSNQARTNHSLLVMWLRQTSLQSCMLRVWLHSAHVKMVTA